MKKILLISLIFISLFAHSQDRIDIPSPQTYDFIRYGNIPVSQYTGSLNLSIPIYKYSDNDFSFGVDINYNSSGFKPNKRSSAVGLDWYINAGGSITRSIEGLPDDVVDQSITCSGCLEVITSGYYALAKQKAFLNRSLNTSDYVFLPDIKIRYNSKNYETSPDMFNFNFMGYSGKFFFDLNGEVRVIADGNFKVDLSKFAAQRCNAATHESELVDSEITITDSKGYVYTFGGSKKYLEYSMGLDLDHDYGLAPKITSWNLRKVKAPNGRELIYEYKNFNNPSGTTSDTQHYLLNAGNWFNLSYNETTGQGLGGPRSGRYHTATKTSYLEKIIIDKTTINFDYVENDFTFYNTSDLGSIGLNQRFNQKNLKLNAIQVKYDTQSVKEFNFKYQNYYNRVFLTDIEEKFGNPYKFTYKQNQILPNPLTNSKDYWGFWNGGNDTGELQLPTFNFSQSGDIQYTSSIQEPNSYSNTAVLTSVTYPTKGTSEFEYELHSYSKKLERKSDNNFFPKLYDYTNVPIAGGIRVSKITDNDAKGNISSREFKYIQNYNNATPGISSGIVNFWPKYVTRMTFVRPASSGWIGALVYYNYPASQWRIYTLTGNNIGYMNYNDNYITYSEVAEVYQNGGFKISKFNTNISNPDITNLQSADLNTFLANPDNKSHVMNALRFDDTSIERGKLKELSIFNSNKKKVSSTSYFYNENPSRFNQYSSGDNWAMDFSHSYRIFSYQYNISKKITTTYDNDELNPITIVDETEYNPINNLIKKTKSTNSKGQEFSTYYKYPSDYNTNLKYIVDCVAYRKQCEIDNKYKCGTDQNCYNVWCQCQTENNYILNGFAYVLKAMNDNNLQFPIEVKQTLNDGTEKVISSSLTEYVYDNTNIVKSKIYNLERSNTAFVDSYLKESKPVLDFTKSVNYFEDVTFKSYYSNGNLKEVSKKDGTSTVYIWGYSQTKPVAKIENASSAQVDPYITTIQNLSNGSDEQSLITELNKLRINLPNAMITTYTYKPLIGLSTTTDPKGYITTYDYDELNRLKLVKDAEGNIISENAYKYKN
ncbi:RHS repeat domain-containing protein [Flavobacterium sp. 3-218]